jgi:hypothetical protein
MSLVSSVRRDRIDAWNRFARLILLPLLAIYALVALVQTHRTEMIVDTVDRQDGNGPVYTAMSRDSGLRMSLRAPFPDWLLSMHTHAVIALLCGVFAQKHLIRVAADSFSRAEGRQALLVHSYLGYAVVVLIMAMDIAGFMMAPCSALDSFNVFIYAFAAPWPLIVGVLVFAARTRRHELHALAGNALVKACFAVPLSRLLGAALQRVVASSLLSESAAYYTGIACATALVSAWQIADIRHYFALVTSDSVKET